MSATGYNHTLRASPAEQNIPFSVRRAAMAEINIIILFVGVFFLVVAVLFSKVIVLENNLTKRILPDSRLRS